MSDWTTLWFDDVTAAAATARVAENIAFGVGDEVSERRRRGGDDHLAVVVWLVCGSDSEVVSDDDIRPKSPPPRAARRSREAAASTCCGVPPAPAGCEARLCAQTGNAANRLRGVRRICKKGEPKETLD